MWPTAVEGGARRTRGEKGVRVESRCTVSGSTNETNGAPLTVIRPDGTADCGVCDLPLYPLDIDGDAVALECANRHRAGARLPEGRAARRMVEHLLAKKGAQMHWQAERRRAERDADEAEAEAKAARKQPRLVRKHELRPAATQTGGMVRHEAHSTDKLWMGTGVTQPHFVSGWHHHGAYESAIYVVNGKIRVESGPGGKTMVEAGPGDFVWVPAGVVHRESNPTPEIQDIVLVRAGEGEVVINVEGPDPD